MTVLELAARVAERDSAVLVLGETGVGKDLVAHAIHQNSRFKDRPFVKVGGGSLRADGNKFHEVEKWQQTQSFERTLYLDEVGELPAGFQSKLLELIQNGEVDDGARKPISVRVIGSSRFNPQTMIAEQKLRPDLYYRLSVVPLLLPPLRERTEDLPELVQHLLERLRIRHRLSNLQIAPSLLARFAQHHWPGNIRELENVLERMLVLSATGELTEQDLPIELQLPGQALEQPLLRMPERGVSLEKVERDLLAYALEKFQGNQTKAARYLNISRRTLIYRMEKHHLRHNDAGQRRET